MKPKLSIPILMTAAALLVGGCGSDAADAVVTPAMVGHWEGDARIIVSWCKQPHLRLALDVHSDGRVTGSIGDAVLDHGRLQRNRGWLGRKLNLATDYIIKGELRGPVVAAEAIARESVSVPLDFIDGAFAGGLHTSGFKFGGKERMILSASSLVLKSNPP